MGTLLFNFYYHDPIVANFVIEAYVIAPYTYTNQCPYCILANLPT
jgi:hypothetical protein